MPPAHLLGAALGVTTFVALASYTAYSPSQSPCSTAANATLCYNMSGCTWNATSETCLSSNCTVGPNTTADTSVCRQIPDMPTCDAMSECQWTSAGCLTACAYSHNNDTACTSDSWCQWNASMQQCELNCAMHDDWSDCANAGCAWNWTYGYCAAPDNNASSSPTAPPQTNNTCTGAAYQLCEQLPQCVWTQYGCLMSCFNLTNATACMSDSWCQWNASMQQCQQNCVLYDDWSDCANAGCAWNWTYGYCAAPASTPSPTGSSATNSNCTLVGDSATCLGIPHCEWTTFGCLATCSYLHHNASSCVRDSWCRWNSSAEQCQLNWTLYDDDDACVTAGGTWNSTTEHCSSPAGSIRANSAAADAHSDLSHPAVGLVVACAACVVISVVAVVVVMVIRRRTPKHVAPQLEIVEAVYVLSEEKSSDTCAVPMKMIN